MSFTTKTCVEAFCDGCGKGWDEDDYGAPHFNVTDDVLQTLVNDYEWSSENGQIFCRNCTHRRICAKDGHLPWTTPARTIGDRTYPEVTYCERCSARLTPR